MLRSAQIYNNLTIDIYIQKRCTMQTVIVYKGNDAQQS